MLDCRTEKVTGNKTIPDLDENMFGERISEINLDHGNPVFIISKKKAYFKKGISQIPFFRFENNFVFIFIQMTVEFKISNSF